VSEERHPGLTRLFAAADRELAGDEFVAAVIERTNVLRRRRLVAVLVAALLAAPVTWLAAGPFVEALLSLMQALSRPLAGSGEGLASPAVLPMNTVGGALVLAALALRAAARRLFSIGR
jgi:hypothetical protein